MTSQEALKEFLDDEQLRTVAQPIAEALDNPAADIDELASRVDLADYHNFYQAYFQAVRYIDSSIPHATRLVELLNALSKRGDLPKVGMYIEEYGLDIAPELGNLTPLDAEEWDSHIDTFTSAQTWAAVYSVHGSIANIRTDLLWNAELVFVNALETSLDSDTQIRASRFYLRAIEQWLEIGGVQLYNLCSGQSQSSRPNWSNDSGVIDHGGDWIWTGGHELNMSRWAFWRGRLAVLSSLEQLDETAQNWARHSFRCMQKDVFLGI